LNLVNPIAANVHKKYCIAGICSEKSTILFTKSVKKSIKIKIG